MSGHSKWHSIKHKKGAADKARGKLFAKLTKGELAHSATRYAQGGVAAALDDRPDDSPELHLSDTIAAGAGLCDPDAVRVLVTEGPERVRELIAMGAVFDQTGDGEAAGLALAREGGHSAARVLHAGGDATGAEIERALVAAVEATAAEVREGWLALDFLVEAGRAVGVTARAPDGTTTEVRARHTIVATVYVDCRLERRLDRGPGDLLNFFGSERVVVDAYVVETAAEEKVGSVICAKEKIVQAVV